MVRSRPVVCLVVTCCVALAAWFIWPHVPLTSATRHRLDQLTPESVVQTYLQARDVRVRTYLLSNEYVEARAGAVHDREYAFRVSNVVVGPAEPWKSDIGDSAWSEEMIVGVEFDSSAHSDNGDGPGHRTRWFILGRMSSGKGWRILEEASGL